MSGLPTYIAAALIETALRQGENGTWRGEATKLHEFASSACNFSVSEEQASAALAVLVDGGIAAITDDPYAGRFYRISGNYLQTIVNRSEDQRREYDRRAIMGDDPDLIFEDGANSELAYLIEHPEIQRYHDFGTEWLQRALQSIETRLREGGPEETVSISDSAEALVIPASDRLVTLGHNQRAALETSANEVIGHLERENAVDGDAEAHSWMLGQLKAGRELIRAGTLHVWLLKATVLNVLNELIVRYKDHAIGVAATVLLELLIKHVFRIE